MPVRDWKMRPEDGRGTSGSIRLTLRSLRGVNETVWYEMRLKINR
jgi:hypothetical protein